MSSFRKTTRFILGILLAIFVCGAYVSSAYADGNAGGGHEGGWEGCNWNPNTCVGGTWKEYPITDEDRANGSIVFSGFSSVSGADGSLPLDKCQDADVYYRLALVDIYNRSEQYPNSVWPMYDFTPVGGGTPYLSTGLPWDEVRQKFETAKRHGAGMDGYSWGSGSSLALFCYSDKWESTGGEVKSDSTVSVPAGQMGVLDGDSATSPKDGTSRTVNVTTTAETINIDFWHKLYFEGNENMPWSYEEYSPVNREVNNQIQFYNFMYGGQPGFKALPSVPVYVPVRFEKYGINWKVTETGNGRSDVASGRHEVDNDTDNPRLWEREVNRNSTSVTLQNGESKTVCQTISYNPKFINWQEGPNLVMGRVAVGYGTMDFVREMNYRNLATSGNGKSTACVKVTRTELTSGDGFQSTSTITIPAQNDVPGYTLTSEKGGTAEIKLSTDAPQLKVQFSHNMYYGDKLGSLAAWGDTNTGCGDGKNSYFDNICSNFVVSWGGDLSGSAASGQHCTGGGQNAMGNSGAEVSKTEYTIDLAEGEEVQVCQEIVHNKLYVEVKPKQYHHQKDNRSHCTDADGEPACYWYDHDHYYNQYRENGSSGLGKSSACVTVVRPENPDDPNNPDDHGTPPTPSDPVITGTPSAKVVYAGEKSDVTWHTEAKAVDTRRLAEYKAINFFVPPSTAYSSSVVKGTTDLTYPNRTTQDPCQWFRGKSQLTWCDIYNSYQKVYNTSSDEESIKTTEFDKGNQTITVPDEVGGKYCNSFGYKWEYWYAYIKDGNAVWSKEEKNSDYWTNYNASCRTVAKKPSVAYWNAGILTNGGVTTSTSSRSHTVPTTGPIADFRADATYGSWTEYLASINKEVKGFSSAAGFSRGGSMNTNLSITTTGGSGISPSEALRTRLEGYLRSLNEGPVDINSLKNVNKTTIAAFDHSITISNNITLENRNYTSIYELPQVILFVDGDVKIAGNVEQIDAWIITSENGNLDTCNTFSSGNSETFARGWNGNRNCDTQLKVNGPVLAAGKVALKRTYGSNPDSEVASNRWSSAEIFNLSAENYLWAYAQASRYASSYTEGYSRELPPRY